MYAKVKTLWGKTKNKSEIARLTGYGLKTVAKAVKNIEKGIEVPKKKPKTTVIDNFKQTILKLIEKDLSAVRIHEELARDGFSGSYSTVKKVYPRDKKKGEYICKNSHRTRRRSERSDFGYIGITKDDAGKNRKTWVFNMRLSYSRLGYYEKEYDQKVETFIVAHIHAFEFFGGVPKYVRIDNLKSAILEANFYEPVYQQVYKDFAAYYTFDPLPCRIARPNDKGKAESGTKFVKSNFFKGQDL